ncbi:unnamed protein product, partial [Medioppia subpectinata]
RGSQVSKRSNSWKLLLENTLNDAFVTHYRKTGAKNESKNSTILDEEELKDIEDMESKPFSSRSHNLKNNETFCGPILEDYVQFVVESDAQNDLFSVKSIKTLCQMDTELLQMKSNVGKKLFEDKCEIRSSGQCCKSWSFHNYITLLAHKKSCDDIDERDIISAKRLLISCAPYYHNLTLNNDCFREPMLCPKAPKHCFQSENAVFNIMHYLVDKDFLSPNSANVTQIKLTNIFLPIAKSTQLLQYFKRLSESDLRMDGLKVVAMDLGLKHTLFDEYLIHDTILLLIAFFVILLSLFLYTTSLTVTVITLVLIITSLGNAYFVYTTVFGISFFPFMNLLAVVIAVGIGSDNALIYCKVWQSIKSDKTSVILVKLIGDTLSHTWVSVFAASFTTGLAFIAALFASTFVAVSFVLTMLLLPTALWSSLRRNYNFQTLKNSRYDFEFKNKFWFKRVRDQNNDYLYYMPIRVVLGVDAEDNGDFLNPSSRGSIQYKPDFDISAKRSQKWLIEFCRQIRNQSFYRPTIGPLLSNCFIETFKSWMEDRECVDAINGLNRNPCCRSSRFPYKPSVFDMCLRQLIDLLGKTPDYYLSHSWAGPRFDKKSLQIVAAVVEYDSIYTFSHSFIEMNKFWTEVNDWVSDQMKSAPKGLQNGWFISSQMDFYALQLSLSEGTVKSILFAVFFAFVALITTTCNWRLSVLSTITISSIIFSTIAILVALNWKLNVLESISILLAIGLAIDFTLHYTIAYKLSTQVENRMNAIHYALCRIGSPVAMSALTTFIAGLLMLFSSILAYIQIGTFLVVLSSISWLYSTNRTFALLLSCVQRIFKYFFNSSELDCRVDYE